MLDLLYSACLGLIGPVLHWRIAPQMLPTYWKTHCTSRNSRTIKASQQFAAGRLLIWSSNSGWSSVCTSNHFDSALIKHADRSSVKWGWYFKNRSEDTLEAELSPERAAHSGLTSSHPSTENSTKEFPNDLFTSSRLKLWSGLSPLPLLPHCVSSSSERCLVKGWTSSLRNPPPLIPTQPIKMATLRPRADGALMRQKSTVALQGSLHVPSTDARYSWKARYIGRAWMDDVSIQYLKLKMIKRNAVWSCAPSPSCPGVQGSL